MVVLVVLIPVRLSLKGLHPSVDERACFIDLTCHLFFATDMAENPDVDLASEHDNVPAGSPPRPSDAGMENLDGASAAVAGITVTDVNALD